MPHVCPYVVPINKINLPLIYINCYKYSSAACLTSSVPNLLVFLEILFSISQSDFGKRGIQEALNWGKA